MNPRVDAFDHIVLTVADIDASCAWYEQVLGMRRVTFEGDRTALLFGRQKLNLHLAGRELEPHARRPAPGTADLCFVVSEPIGDVVAALERDGVTVELGPVERTGAAGLMDSVYLRDPDGNLIEVASYRSRQRGSRQAAE